MISSSAFAIASVISRRVLYFSGMSGMVRYRMVVWGSPVLEFSSVTSSATALVA